MHPNLVVPFSMSIDEIQVVDHTLTFYLQEGEKI